MPGAEGGGDLGASLEPPADLPKVPPKKKTVKKATPIVTSEGGVVESGAQASPGAVEGVAEGGEKAVTGGGDQADAPPVPTPPRKKPVNVYQSSVCTRVYMWGLLCICVCLPNRV